MSDIPDWLTQLSLHHPNDQSVVEQIRTLSTQEAICLITPNINRSLSISAEVAKNSSLHTIWVNFAGCFNDKDALLCLAEALGSFQGEEQLLATLLEEKPTLIIAQQLPSELLNIISIFRRLAPRSQWLILSKTTLDNSLYSIEISVISDADLPAPQSILDQVLLLLPAGLPIEYQGSLSIIRCGTVCIANPQYTQPIQANNADQITDWLIAFLHDQLSIYKHLNIPMNTTSSHLFALYWLQTNSTDSSIVQHSRIAISMILQAWNQPLRALHFIQNTPIGGSNPTLLISATILHINIQLCLGHWEQSSLLSKRTLQMLRSNASLPLRAELRRQLANIYITWGKKSQAEKELQQALRLSERSHASVLRSRILRDIASLGLSNNESISPYLILGQIDCGDFSSADYAHYLLTKSEILQHRDQKQPAEIALNQAESIDNDTPLSIANRQRSRAAIALASGQYDAALQLAKKACHRFSFCGEHIAHAHSTRLIADILSCQGNAQLAFATYQKALHLQLQLRDNHGLFRTVHHLQILLQHHQSPLADDIQQFIDDLSTT